MFVSIFLSKTPRQRREQTKGVQGVLIDFLSVTKIIVADLHLQDKLQTKPPNIDLNNYAKKIVCIWLNAKAK